MLINIVKVLVFQGSTSLTFAQFSAHCHQNGLTIGEMLQMLDFGVPCGYPNLAPELLTSITSLTF